MQYSQEFSKLDSVKLGMTLYSSSQSQVLEAIENAESNLSALSVLLSPAAEPFIELMAQASNVLTRQRFGQNINMYLPMYLSNLCANECDYCGFTMSNKIRRKTLSIEEITSEINVIKAKGYDNILLVSGEHETKVGFDYFKSVMPIIKDNFSHVSLEVQPLKQDEYQQLTALGLDAVMIYQETYQQQTYTKHHTRGKKQDFGYRLNTPDRVAAAGVDKIGLGVLLGLDDWRQDALMLGHHLDYLQNKYWRTKYSLSLPRLRPCVGGITPKTVISDLGLVQMICAFRLFNPQLEISLSTRESASLRDNLLPLGITNMSAESSTQPGGYSQADTELDQFEIDDNRTTLQVVDAIRHRGFNPVWKDWQSQW
ncbi:2-iminoacetate synthase ThiH [Shewanella maritima]|uniref:2-iminoacetate synthase ThiH n=1 Tax=Shewanella maritima TaxID=2520507 RepID=UPI00373624FB